MIQEVFALQAYRERLHLLADLDAIFLGFEIGLRVHVELACGRHGILGERAVFGGGVADLRACVLRALQRTALVIVRINDPRLAGHGRRERERDMQIVARGCEMRDALVRRVLLGHVSVGEDLLQLAAPVTIHGLANHALLGDVLDPHERLVVLQGKDASRDPDDARCLDGLSRLAVDLDLELLEIRRARVALRTRDRDGISIPVAVNVERPSGDRLLVPLATVLPTITINRIDVRVALHVVSIATVGHRGNRATCKRADLGIRRLARSKAGNEHDCQRRGKSACAPHYAFRVTVHVSLPCLWPLYR